MQTKSENHETCRGVVLSHVEAMVKNYKGFEQVVTSDAKNPDISTCDHSAKLIFKNKKNLPECLALALGKISFKKLKKNCRVPRFTLGKINF